MAEYNTCTFCHTVFPKGGFGVKIGGEWFCDERCHEHEMVGRKIDEALEETETAYHPLELET